MELYVLSRPQQQTLRAFLMVHLNLCLPVHDGSHPVITRLLKQTKASLSISGRDMWLVGQALTGAKPGGILTAFANILAVVELRWNLKHLVLSVGLVLKLARILTGCSHS